MVQLHFDLEAFNGVEEESGHCGGSYRGCKINHNNRLWRHSIKEQTMIQHQNRKTIILRLFTIFLLIHSAAFLSALSKYLNDNKMNRNNKIYCKDHQKDSKEIVFVCRSDKCEFKPLCQKCLQDPNVKHQSNDLIPISYALQQASINLTRQKEVLDDIIQPFNKRKQLFIQIQRQKKRLLQEKERLVRYIQTFIDSEIERLIEANKQFNIQSSDKTLDQDVEKMSQKIEKLLKKYDKNASQLQQALNLDISKLTNSKNGQKNKFEAANFKYYTSTTYEFVLKKLELTTQSTTIKPFRKVMNESPLYFLIDPAYNSSPYLYNFNHKKDGLQIYNVDDQEWTIYHPKEYKIYEKGAAVYDPYDKQFFWIGGIQGEKKLDTILIFSLPKQAKQAKQPVEPEKKRAKWEKIKLKIPRSSCMATLIKLNQPTAQKTNPREIKRGILVVGGVGPKGEVLKSCEYIDLVTKEVSLFGETNFATYSGALAMFNNSVVLRLGGLSKNGSGNVVVEVVQKFDCQDAIQLFYKQKDKKETQRKLPRWSYIEFEFPKGDFLANPKLFYANQAAVQINPNQVFIFGGLDANFKGVTESYLINLEEFTTHSREVRKDRNTSKHQRFLVRWVNEKPLITGDDFGGLQPIISRQRLYTFQNMSGKDKDKITDQKRLLEFDMYQWYQTENVLPL